MKDAAQPDRVEGIRRAPMADGLMIHVGSRSTATVERSVWGSSQLTLSTFLWEETGVLGENPRLSVECMYVKYQYLCKISI